MMKSCLRKTALVVLLAGVTLSAGAKPGEVQQSQAAISGDRQNSDLLMVAAVSATTALSGRRDRPISRARR